MTRFIFMSLAFTAMLAGPALAGTPPTPSDIAADRLAAACGALGERSEAVAGGCIDTATGSALTCGTDGTCTGYFADPRYRKIKAILDGARKQRAPIRL